MDFPTLPTPGGRQRDFGVGCGSLLESKIGRKIESRRPKSAAPRVAPVLQMEPTKLARMEPPTLASSDRSLERIGPFVRVEDYPLLMAVGRTFAQGAAVLTGFRRSIPERYRRNGKRRAAALDLHATSLGTHAEPYIVRALREDPSECHRARAASWLVDIGNRSDNEVVWQRICRVAAECDERGVCRAMRDIFDNACGLDMLGRHVQGSALFAYVAANHARVVEELNKMDVGDLKMRLRDRRIKMSGKKAELKARLLEEIGKGRYGSWDPAAR